MGWSNELPNPLVIGGNGIIGRIEIRDAGGNLIGYIDDTGLWMTDTDGSYVHVYDENPGDGAVIDINPADVPGHVISKARVRCAVDPITQRPGIVLTGPQMDGGQQATLNLASRGLVPLYALAEMTAGGITLTATNPAGLPAYTHSLSLGTSLAAAIALETDSGNALMRSTVAGGLVTLQGDYVRLIPGIDTQINGKSYPRGLVCSKTLTIVGPTSNNVAVEFPLTAWDPTSDATCTFQPSRLYWYHLQIHPYTAAAGAGRAIVYVRKTVNNTASQQLGYHLVPTIGSSLPTVVHVTGFIKNATGADVVASLGLGIKANSGGNATLYADGTSYTTLDVYDIGDINDHAGRRDSGCTAIT